MTMNPAADTWQQNAWTNVLLGADVPAADQHGSLRTARGAIVPEGPFLHAYLKFRLPGSPKVYMLKARIDLRDVEKGILRELAQKTGHTPTQIAAAGGKIWRKIKKGVKKIAKSKLVRGIVAVAKKAFNNPLVKAMISATPFGAAITATAAAARVAAKAIKGGIKARKALRSIAARAKQGQPDAIKAARLVQKGMQLTGIQTPAVSVTASLPAPTIVDTEVAPDSEEAAAAGEGHYLSAILGACCAGQGSVPAAVCGADQGDASDMELDAFETFATAGAFEGVRWAARQLVPHSMFGPGHFSKREALQMGLQVMSAPRA
jgi:hypothetical protein